MSKKLFIANLSYSTTDEALKNKLAEYGAVESVKVITDRDTGRSRGFAFAEMVEEEGAQKAIEELHDQEFDGRKIIVREARPKE